MLITTVSAKGAPGVTTMVAALASLWPAPVLVVDADPDGGDLLPGWTARWWIDGHVRADRGVVSFASDTRFQEDDSVPASALAAHVQSVPDVTHVRLLAGVASSQQARAVQTGGWLRLAQAARNLTDSARPDVLVDAGGLGSETPWPLLSHADLVLLAVRPTLCHLRAASPQVARLREAVPGTRIALAVLASPERRAQDMSSALDLDVEVVWPDDPYGARAFSDGLTPVHTPRQRPLLGAARKTAQHLTGMTARELPDEPKPSAVTPHCQYEEGLA